MAPELLEGGAATVSSDLFSLGLVLYELFTGKHAFESTGLLDLKRVYAESPAKTPSSWINDLDPLVESAVMRCLERDPARRPTSALQVLAALPGGDPLQAALLAGETPSPAAVAAAGSREAMPVSSALWWVAALTVSVIALSILTPRLAVSIQSGILPPDTLEARGRAMMSALGYVKPPFEAWHVSRPDGAYQLHVRLTAPPGEGWNRLLHDRPHPFIGEYRESPDPLVPLAAPFVRGVDPPLAPGMSYLRMDGLGRLKRVEVVPYAWDTSSPVATGADWPAAFQLAGLNIADFTAVPPERTSPRASDARVAWMGRYPGQKDEIRIEAAAYRGRVVFFETIEAWELPTEGQAPASPLAPNPIVRSVLTVVMVIVIFGSLVLAWRNYQSGRGDRRGAWRFGLVVFAGNVAGFIVNEWPGVMGKGGLLWLLATQALNSGVLTGLMYFAVEPYVRRWWPTTIITWSRLLAGEWRDPLVGRDVLIGTTIGVLLWLLSAVHATVEVSAGNAAFAEFVAFSAQYALFGVLQLTTDAEFTMGGFLLFALARTLLRRTWLAAGVVWLLVLLPSISRSPLDMVVTGISAAIYLWITARWGLLVLLVGAFHLQPVLTFDPRQWYFGGSLVHLLFIAACAWYGLRTATAGRPVVSPRWLEG
jgi:serine/threonine-protein kinase